MEKAKSKAEILRERKKLMIVEAQKKESTIKEIMEKINSFSKDYNTVIFETAVGRWKRFKQENRSAEKEIAKAEQKLLEVKRRYGK